MNSKITPDVTRISMTDRDIDLFEGLYDVPNGITYNSHVIFDAKTAVLDTVDARYVDAWMDELEKVLNGRTPDYLIISHMEPDHSSGIAAFAKKYAGATIVGNAKTFAMTAAFFGDGFESRRKVVADGEALDLGKHKLKFVFAPMVHWPEVMLCYDSADKILFSADAFGKFGAEGAQEPWEPEARRYYFGIVGKYGVPVSNLLKKLGGEQVDKICPLHGPVLDKDLDRYIGLYDKWSKYLPETNGVMIAYTSVYGNTAKAAGELEKELESRGAEVATYDLARRDWSDCVAAAFMHGKLVLATTTYNGEIFPAMREFINNLIERNYQNRTVGIIENGSWAPTAAKCIKAMLEKCKDISYTPTTVTVKSALDADSRAAVAALADELAK